MLSVGSASGLAHLGAIEALRETSIKIDCVAGSSMGALVGALYASAPDEDTTLRYESLARAYGAETRREANGRATVGGILGAGVVALFGGPLAPALAVGGLGAMAGAGTTPQADHARIVAMLGETTGHAQIEALPLRYGFSSHYLRIGENVEPVADRYGDLAAAVGRSIANPLLFPGLAPQTSGALDPGVDRVSAVPLDDLCATLPHTEGPHGTRFTLIAINVTGRPAYFRDRRCRVVEVAVAMPATPPSAMFGFGPDYRLALGLGYQATCKALGGDRPGQCSRRVPQPESVDGNAALPNPCGLDGWRNLLLCGRQEQVRRFTKW